VGGGGQVSSLLAERARIRLSGWLVYLVCLVCPVYLVGEICSVFLVN
jgi:hypothetical protein